MFVRSDSLGGVVVSDLEYPQRVVFTLLNKVSHKNMLQMQKMVGYYMLNNLELATSTHELAF